MNDGIKQAFSTTLVLTENPGYTQQQIKDHLQEYLGIEQYHFMPDPIVPYHNIQHIDCWSKILSPDKVLVDSVAPSNPNYNKFQARASEFAALTSSYGTPMKVVRAYTPGATSSSPITPYSNSLILNNKVFVPTTNKASNANDIAALQVFQQAMPGYEIIGIDYGNWINTDALHCRTHEIADRCMLYIKHQPLFGNITNTGSVTFNAELYSYCNNTIYPDSALIYLKHSGGGYEKYNMTYSGDNSWTVTVAALPSGLIEYYVFAADDSGRRESHPYIARYAPNTANVPHKFTLVGDAPDLPLLAIDKTASSVTSEAFAVIEDYITISNIGAADLTFEITDINFHEMLTIIPLNGTIQSGGSQIITLSYNFASIENDEYTGSFKLLSNDPLHPATAVSLQAIQNVTTDIPILVLDKTHSSVQSEELTIVEDYITVSNTGNADLTIEIPLIDFDEILTITPLEATLQPGDSQIITLSYDFNNVAKVKEYIGSFTLFSNDPLRPEVEITLQATLNLALNEADISGIMIYPNPTRGKLRVSPLPLRDFPQRGKEEDSVNGELRVESVEVLDIFGKTVLKLETLNTKHETTFDLSNVSPGVYFIKIGANVYKFIKQ
jgi:hypothetical protein